MKMSNYKLTIVLFIVIVHIYSSGFAQDTTYYLNSFQVTNSKDSCEFYQVTGLNLDHDSTVELTFYKSGELKCMEKTVFKNTYLEKGRLVSYYRNGYVSCESFRDYSRAFSTRKLTTYWMNGNVKRIENYNEVGDTLDGRCFGMNGKDTTFYPYEIMPKFPGGQDTLSIYLSNNIIYPKECLEKNVSANVTTKFIINADGTISDLKVTKVELNYKKKDDQLISLFSNETIRVIHLMPLWIPGKQDGENVKVRVTLPIKFTIKYKSLNLRKLFMRNNLE